MGSRIREKPDHLFEVFVEIAISEGDGGGPFIIQQYPEDYGDKEALAMIPKFAYPCVTDASQVDHFTFVLTDVESNFRFGYCRHATGHQTCLCIVSCLPWCEVFFKMLDLLGPISNSPDPGNGVMEFLHTAYAHDVPVPNIPVTIVAGENMFTFTSPDPNVLPSIPKSRNLTEYYNAVDPPNMMRIFASMVQERRIYMTSKKLSRLTACIHAAEALLYPMHWQHLYIPVLPAHLIDYISAPMPYLIGVHSNLVEKLQINRVDVADAVIVDLDTNTVTTEYDDLENLPEDVQSYLKKSLKTDVVRNSMTKNGDAISVAFLQALVRLIGGYREALKIRPEEPITFDPEVFVRSRPSQATQAYLEGMLALQIFQQFIYGRLEILNSGVGFTDIFEQLATEYTDKLNSQSNYKEWLKSVKKGGRRGREVLSGLKVKAAPMMSGAVHSVKVQGKKAFADVRNKMSNIKDHEDKRSSTFQVSGGRVHSKSGKNHASAHSISEDRRPKRPPRPPPPSTGSDGRNSALVKEDSQDDSQLRLSYHTVDVSLMGDQDIQAAMMRSASAEVLPKNGESWSGSTSTISSDSRSVDDTDSANIPFGSLHSSDDESMSSLVDVPQVGYKSQSSTSGYSTTSSDHVTVDRLIVKPKPKQGTPASPTGPSKQNQQQQPALPSLPPRTSPSSSSSSSKPPVIPPRAPTDPSATTTTTAAQPLRPPPRRPNASRQPIQQQQEQQQQQSTSSSVTAQDAPLIKFESSESEATDSEVFDPLVLSKSILNSSRSSSQTQPSPGVDCADGLASVADVTIRDKGNNPENKNFQRSSSSRSSLSRSKAFRRESTNKVPLRKGSSFADDEDDDNNDIITGNDSRCDNDDEGTRSSTQNPTTDIFDPLTTLSSLSVSTSSSSPQTTTVSNTDSKISPGMAAPLQSRQRRDSSADLMKHEWSLAFLATGPRVRLPLSGQQQSQHLPRQSTLPTNPSFAIHHPHHPHPHGTLLHQSSMQATPSSSSPSSGVAPYRSRPFSNSPQNVSPFQYIGGSPVANTTAGGGSLSSSPQQEQQQKQQPPPPLVPTSSLSSSSSNPKKSPSTSPMLARQKFESLSSTTTSSSSPSSSFYNNSSTKPSAFSSPTPSPFSTSSSSSSPFNMANRSTSIQQQQCTRKLLNSAANSPAKHSSRQAVGGQYPLSSSSTASTTNTSNSSADPFGDLLDIQFGGGSNSTSKQQQQQQQQNQSGQTNDSQALLSGLKQNPSASSGPPAPKWETFE